MCGGGNDAAEEARKDEAIRKQEIAQTTAAIDAAFGRRQPQYDDYLSATRDFYTTDAKRQKEVADRRSKFALAGAGLTGGSTHRDTGKRLGREFNRGILRAEQTAQSSLADLMAADTEARLNLTSLASTGLDVGSAASQAARMMQSNIAGAKARNTTDSLGDIFGGSADVYKKQEEAAARRRGLKESELYATPFSRGT